MIQNLSIWIEILFVLVFLITLALFYFSNGRPKKVITGIIFWSIIQMALSLIGFYQIQSSFPRFVLVLFPAFLCVGIGLLPKQISWMLNKRNTRLSTFLHTVRFPIEIILFQLYLNEMIPQLMTFEGRNFDIIIGITAPLVGYFHIKKLINHSTLIFWNVLGLFLVSFILLNGILSSELPFQQFAFDQPNKAVTFFPFILLPAVVVPIVLWTHITDILKLVKQKKQ